MRGDEIAGTENAPLPVVSVIIPTYNRAHLLPRALESVLAQTDPDFEILVVDDASTDATHGVTTAYDDARIRYFRQPENRGVAAARNRGLREARGEFVAFLDSDDEWFPDKLALQVARFRELGPEAGLIYSGVETVRDGGVRSIETPVFAGNIYRDMLLRNVIHGGGSNAMIRREIVRHVGYFDEGLPAIEDYDYWLRIARRYLVDFVEEPLIRYYDHEPAKAKDAKPVDRRSRAVEKNLVARDMFYDRYSREMRRVGVARLFLIDSAWRHLEAASSAWDVRRARRLLVRSLRQRPLHLDVHYRLLRTMISGPAGRLLKDVRRGIGHRLNRTRMPRSGIRELRRNGSSGVARAGDEKDQ